MVTLVLSATPTPIPPVTGVNRAVVTVEGAAIRFAADGSGPFDGHRVCPGTVIVLEGSQEIHDFTAVALGPGATLRITFEQRSRGLS